MITREDIVRLIYTPEQIKEKTTRIYQEVLAASKIMDHGNFSTMALEDLTRMFQLYDHYFFDGFFDRNMPGKIFFQLSSGMTAAAGKTTCQRRTRTYTITLSTALLLQTFSDIRREVVVNGIVCRDRLQAAQRILEHEITHLLERELFNTGSDCFGPRYRRLVKKLFGHSDVTHQLVTPLERAEKKFHIKEGDEVVFEYQGQMIRGTIFRIGTEAVILVPDPGGIYLDFHRRRCSRYHVPVECLMRTFV